mgnify:CR=1 FL=1
MPKAYQPPTVDPLKASEQDNRIRPNSLFTKVVGYLCLIADENGDCVQADFRTDDTSVNELVRIARILSEVEPQIQ